MAFRNDLLIAGADKGTILISKTGKPGIVNILKLRVILYLSQQMIHTGLGLLIEVR